MTTGRYHMVSPQTSNAHCNNFHYYQPDIIVRVLFVDLYQVIKPKRNK